jgi:serine/threonine protein kinase
MAEGHPSRATSPDAATTPRPQLTPQDDDSSQTRTFAVSQQDNAIGRPIIGGSTARRAASLARIDTQPTVISKQTPGSTTPPVHHLHPAEMGRVLEGQTLGHYELQEFVGGGGMGAVFRALDTMLNRTVAVKVLSHDQSDDEETLRRFKNEAQSAARLDHENIGRVHYVGEDGGWHYIVFEFIEGINLREIVHERGPLSINDSVSYMLQLGDALAHASRRDVVHRDIKPSNVIVTPEGRAKLVDMGLARLHQVEHANNDLTASGVTLGTFDYISPEQARDPRSADVRSDLYSLGCTFYFMITGRPPFPEGTVLQKLLQHQSDEPVDPRFFCPNLPDDLLRIMKRLLAKSPDDRYQDPGELVADLTVAASRLGLRPSAPGSMVWLAGEPRRQTLSERHLPWLAPSLALVIIVIILNVIWSPDQENTSRSLLGRVPRPESPLKNNVASASEPRSTVNADANRKRPIFSNENNTTNNSAKPQLLDQNEVTALPDWVRSAAPLGKQLVSDVWDQVPIEKVTGGLQGIHESYIKPLRIDLRAGSRQRGPDRIVTGRSRPGEFASLATAIREAKSGDIIELRYDGALDEPPLLVTSTKLSLRAGESFAPVIRFVPQFVRGSGSPRSMLTVRNGQLALHQVHLEFDAPSDSAERWAVFELNDADSLRLQSCSITVRNIADEVYAPAVAVIEIRRGSYGEPSTARDAAKARTPVEVVVNQTIVRGETTLVHSPDGEPSKIRIDDSLIAITERLLEADMGTSQKNPMAAIALEIGHSTFLVRQGLLRLVNDRQTQVVMPMDIRMRDSIVSAAGGGVLVEQSGDGRTSDLRRQLTWRGDRNFYDGFETFWRIAASGMAQNLDFDDWQLEWEDREISQIGPIGWVRSPLASRVFHTLVPADFVLRADESGAIRAATDGQNAGAAITRLPALPHPVRSLAE